VIFIVQQASQSRFGALMARISPTFASSDSWILLALRWAGSERPASLPDILYSADGINKAIPTAEELDGALNRLLAAEFISQEKGGFRLTELAHATIAQVLKARQGIFDLWEDLSRLLACPCSGPTLRSVRRRVTITKADVRKAHNAYFRRVHKELWRASK
jgi:hypothetical protein